MIVNSRKGFSLVEMMVSIILAGAIVVFVSQTIVGIKSNEHHAGVQSMIDSRYGYLMQYSRSLKYIKQRIGIHEGDICYSKPGACSGQDTNWQILESPSGDMNVSYALNGSKCPETSNCPIKTQFQYRRQCPINEVCRIILKIRVYDSAAKFVPRESLIELEGAQLVSRERINFTCSQGGDHVSNVDFKKKTAYCLPAVDIISSLSGLPLGGFNSVSNGGTPVSQVCPMGYSSLGSQGTQQICLSPSVSPSPGTEVKEAGCASTVLTWGETNKCRSAVDAATSSGQMVNLKSVDPIGDAVFECPDMKQSWRFVSGTCRGRCENQNTKSMTWHSSNCAFLLKTGVWSHGDKFTLYPDPNLSYGGANQTNSWMRFRCYDGKFLVDDARCWLGDINGQKGGKSCPGGVLSWDASNINSLGPCRGTIEEGPSGLAVSVGNTQANYQGRIDTQCIDGKWTDGRTGIGCRELAGKPQACKGKWVSEVVNGCQYQYDAPIEGVPSGWVRKVDNFIPGYVGSVTLSCADGVWWIGAVVQCTSLGQVEQCPALNECFDLLDQENKPVRPCFKQDPTYHGVAIVQASNLSGCMFHLNCEHGIWSYTKPGGLKDFSGTCKKP